MAVGIVQELEAIGVDHSDGEGSSVAAGTAEFNGEAIVDIAAIQEAG